MNVFWVLISIFWTIHLLWISFILFLIAQNQTVAERNTDKRVALLIRTLEQKKPD